MGLEIFYDLHAPEEWPRERVRTVVENIRAFATTLGLAEVDPVIQNDLEEPRTLVIKDAPEGHHYPPARASDGWFFRTWPGARCETASFGLCWFPGTVIVGDKTIATGWGDGWHYHTWCKTQFADRVSREHFLHCHRSVVAILDAFREAGVEVNVRDGSGYWQHRDKAELERQIEEWNSVIAAIAGAFKDGTEELDGQVVSAIFEAPDFERLEAKGHEVLQRKRQQRRKEPKSKPGKQA